jgi:hypothetical protein
MGSGRLFHVPRRLRPPTGVPPKPSAGWIDRRGRFWPCQPYRHRQAAELLVSRILRLDPGDMSPDDFLSLRLRWVPVEINGVIGFHTAPEDWTQSQLDMIFDLARAHPEMRELIMSALETMRGRE